MPTEYTNEIKGEQPLIPVPENQTMMHPRILGQSARESFTDYANPRDLRIRLVPGENIADAIDRITQAGAGTLFLREGTYIVTREIKLTSHLSIVGESRDSSVIDFNSTAGKLSGAGTNVYTTGTITSISSDGSTVTGSGTSWLANVVALRDHFFINQRWHLIAAVTGDTTLILAENYSGPTVSAGSTYRIATPISDIQIENISIKNSTGTSLDMDDGRNCLLRNVFFQDSNIGFSFENFTEIGTDFIITVSHTSDGGQFVNAGFSSMRGVASESNGGHGIRLDTCRTLPFFTSGSNRNTGDGYSVLSCNDVLLEVQANANLEQGIELVSGNDNIIIQNALVDNNSSDGIKLTATSDNCKIVTSDINNNSGYGVNIAAATCDNTVIYGCSFSGNTSGQINNSGTTTKVDLNNVGSEYTTAKARAYRATNQTLTTGVSTKISLDTETYDPGANFDSTTNYRFTAPVAGFYTITAQVILAAPVDQAVLQIDVQKNGADLIRVQGSASGTSDQGPTVTDVVQLVKDDYLELRFTHTSGVDKSVIGGSNTVYMTVQLLST